MEIVEPEVISGGFFVAALCDRWDWMPDFLPERVVSVDPSLTEIVPRQTRAPSSAPNGLESLGEPADRWLDAALANGNLVWPHHLASPDVGRELISVAGLSPDDFWVLGVGLPSARLEPRFEPLEDYEVEHFLRARSPLPEGGEALGFEISAFVGYTISESWLHDDLEREAVDRFGLRLNNYGLIDTVEEAERITAWVNEESELGRTCAVGPSWDPWLIVRYAGSDTD